MDTLGYLAALVIGFSLGLIGGGGSLLTVPALVYLLGLGPVIATAYSLFIVGLTSLVGSYQFYKRGQVSLQTAFVFGLPSIVAVYTTRRYVVPAIPDSIFTIGGLEVTKGMMLMLLFASLMIFASFSMIRQNKKANGTANENSEDGVSDERREQANAPEPKYNYGGEWYKRPRWRAIRKQKPFEDLSALFCKTDNFPQSL